MLFFKIIGCVYFFSDEARMFMTVDAKRVFLTRKPSKKSKFTIRSQGKDKLTKNILDYKNHYLTKEIKIAGSNVGMHSYRPVFKLNQNFKLVHSSRNKVAFKKDHYCMKRYKDTQLRFEWCIRGKPIEFYMCKRRDCADIEELRYKMGYYFAGTSWGGYDGGYSSSDNYSDHFDKNDSDCLSFLNKPLLRHSMYGGRYNNYGGYGSYESYYDRMYDPYDVMRRYGKDKRYKNMNKRYKNMDYMYGRDFRLDRDYRYNRRRPGIGSMFDSSCSDMFGDYGQSNNCTYNCQNMNGMLCGSYQNNKLNTMLQQCAGNNSNIGNNGLGNICGISNPCGGNNGCYNWY